MAAFSGNVIYFARFYGYKSVIQYRVEISKAGYAGGSTEITNLAARPLIYQHIDVEGSTIQGSEMIFSFMCDSANYAQFDLLTQGADFDYQFKLFDASDTSRALWTGYILPNETSRGYFDKLSVYTLTATDYLSRLKYKQFTNAAGNIPAQRVSVADIVGWTLNKIPDFHDVLIQCGLTAANMSGAGSPLSKAYVYPDVFTKVQDGLVITSDCYSVLDNSLRAFNCRICTPLKRKSNFDSESDTRYYILNNDQTNGLLYNSVYNSGSDRLPAYKTVSFTSIVNIDSYTFLTQSEFARKFPVKAINLVQHNQEAGQQATADNFYDVTNNVIWSRVNINTITGAAATGISIVTTSVANSSIRFYKWYTLTNSGNRYIRLNFVLRNYGDVSSNISINPIINIYKKSPGGVITSTSESLPTLSGRGGYFSYISPQNAMYEITDGYSYQIELSFNTVSGGSQIMKPCIQNFIFSTYNGITGGEATPNVITDEVFTGVSDTSASPNDSIEIKFGDSDKTTNKAALTYDTDDTHLLAGWSRFGVTETKTMQELILQSYFNRFGGNSKVLKLTVVDENCTINLFNKIQINSDVYQILDYIRDFKAGTVELRLLQIASTDVSITVTRNIVPASGPNSGNSTSGGGVAVSNPTTDHGSLSGLSDNDHPQYLLVSNYQAPITDHGGLSGLSDDDHMQYAKKAGDTFSGYVGFGGVSPGKPIHSSGEIRVNRIGNINEYGQVSFEQGVLTLESSNGYYYILKNIGNWSNPHMVITGSGLFGFGGIVSPSYFFDVAGSIHIASLNGTVEFGNGVTSATYGSIGFENSANYLEIKHKYASGGIKLYTNSTVETARLTTGGDLHVKNELIAYSSTLSDKKLKKGIKKLKYGLKELLKLKPVEYILKSTNKKHLGFIAQDVEPILKEVVTDKEYFDDKIKAISYHEIIPVLVASIQEQQEQINNLRIEIFKLKCH